LNERKLIEVFGWTELRVLSDVPRSSFLRIEKFDIDNYGDPC